MRTHERCNPAFAIVLLGLAVLAAAPAQAQGAPEADTVLALSQAAIGRQLGDYRLTDQSGRHFTLEELHGKPVVLSLIYSSCYHVCSGLTVHLRDVVRVARATLGQDSFAVLTVGFDTPRDTPDRMRMYARERGIDLPGWYFAGSDAATIERLARDAGFTYFASPKGFDHVTQTTLVDATGKVVLQVYGEDFAPPVLVEPLKKLVWGGAIASGTLEGLLDTVRLLCTIYDPSSGRYRFDYSLIVNVVSGVLALGMIAAAIVLAVRNVR